MYTFTTRQSRGKGPFFSTERGQRKRFWSDFLDEEDNHLGNVLAVISDKVKLYSRNKITLDSARAEVVSASDYYPFGLPMKGRQFNEKNYRYGFNGKENDNEFSWQDYGMRMYMQKIGRFPSVDPITAKYPMLTPYQFASNTPIQAIDLDGLEAFFIHGTRSSSERWITDGKPNAGTMQLFRLQNSKYINTGFNWGGAMNYGNGFFNDVEDRTRAAKKLVKYIMKSRVEGEDITMLAHSHGGNVAIQAAPMLRAALDKVGAEEVKINIVTVSTPAVNNSESVENPANSSSSINTHIHIYNIQDRVQKQLANDVDRETYDRRYTNSSTQNVQIDVSKEYEGTTTEAHSVDQSKPEVIKRNIDNGNIPKIKK